MPKFSHQKTNNSKNKEADIAHRSHSLFSNSHAKIPIIQQQRTIGNQATQRFAENCLRSLPSPSLCPFGGACHTCPPRMQTKLRIGEPNSKYEKEADLVKDEIMAMPAIEVAESHSYFEKPLESSAIKQAHLSPFTSSGKPLPESVRLFFEPRFGRNLSHIRIHTDPRAAQLSELIHARAFAYAHDIIFNAGEFAPGTTAGKLLLAHELSHVIQYDMLDYAASPMILRQRDEKKQKGFSDYYEECLLTMLPDKVAKAVAEPWSSAVAAFAALKTIHTASAAVITSLGAGAKVADLIATLAYLGGAEAIVEIGGLILTYIGGMTAAFFVGILIGCAVTAAAEATGLSAWQREMLFSLYESL